MKNFKRLRSLGLATFCLVLLAGFTGQEKFVELQGYLNGRSSSAFRKQDSNVLSVLEKGTKGAILESKKMRSGNYGLLVKVLSGPKVGKSFWVYYNVKNPDLALYETAPQSWEQGRATTAAVEEAQGAETIRDTQAIVETVPATAEDKAAAGVETAPASDALPSYVNAFAAIEEGNAIIGKVGIPTPRPPEGCTECSKEAGVTPAKPLTVAPATRRMAPACSSLVDNKGKIGYIGKSLMSIMSERRYKAHYTKSNALGKFCPRFNELSENHKLQAWTWFWTALATEESQCIVDIRHATTYKDKRGRVRTLNPREGFGLWAMEKDAGIRRGRGAACADISGGAGQARCTIDIMMKTQLDDGHSASSDSGSYWGPVRRGNSQIMPHMRRFSLCF